MPLPLLFSSTRAWLRALRTIAVVNVLAWTTLVVVVDGGVLRVSSALAGVYVAGCAFRAWLPRDDLTRHVLVVSTFSSVAWGRAVATVAELAFATLAAMRVGRPAIVGVLLVAEAASTTGVLTRRPAANALEESLWTLAACMYVRGAITQGRSSIELFIAGLYIVYMIVIDVPAYARASNDDAVSLAVGWRQVSRCGRRVDDVEAWRFEMLWQTAYFSLAVWFAIAMAMTQ